MTYAKSVHTNTARAAIAAAAAVAIAIVFIVATAACNLHNLTLKLGAIGQQWDASSAVQCVNSGPSCGRYNSSSSSRSRSAGSIGRERAATAAARSSTLAKDGRRGRVLGGGVVRLHVQRRAHKRNHLVDKVVSARQCKGLNLCAKRIRGHVNLLHE